MAKATKMNPQVYRYPAVNTIEERIQQLEQVRAHIVNHQRELDRHIDAFLSGGAYPDEPFDQAIYVNLGNPDEAEVISAQPLTPLQYAELVAGHRHAHAGKQRGTASVQHIRTCYDRGGETRIPTNQHAGSLGSTDAQLTTATAIRQEKDETHESIHQRKEANLRSPGSADRQHPA